MPPQIADQSNPVNREPLFLARRLPCPAVREAAAIVAGWFERPNVTLLNPGERHWGILRAMMTKGQARGPLITDAHLAALAIEHGAALATTDRDFARFPGLNFFDPLDTA
jgi:hypothetical protein